MGALLVGLHPFKLFFGARSYWYSCPVFTKTSFFPPVIRAIISGSIMEMGTIR